MDDMLQEFGNHRAQGPWLFKITASQTEWKEVLEKRWRLEGKEKKSSEEKVEEQREKCSAARNYSIRMCDRCQNGSKVGLGL